MKSRETAKDEISAATDACWENLANAIIVQAVDDYLAAHRVLKDDPDNLQAKATKRDVLSFLKSDWYETLTNVDASVIVGHLENKTGEDIDL